MPKEARHEPDGNSKTRSLAVSVSLRKTANTCSAETDVAAALGYSNPRDAIIRHCRYVVKRDAPHPQSLDRKISMTFIPEGDLYRLIVHSKLPSQSGLNSGYSMRSCLLFVSTGPISQKRSCGRLPLPRRL